MDEEPTTDAGGYAAPIHAGEHPMNYMRRALVMIAPNSSQAFQNQKQRLKQRIMS